MKSVVATWLIDLLYGLLFSSPAFFANATPVFVSGLGRMDFNKNFIDGNPILGAHKTFGGLIGAILSGGLLGIAGSMYFPNVFYGEDISGYTWLIGFLLGFGAMLGDAIGSFLKRRLNLKPGRPFLIVDQVGFVVVAFLVVSPFVSYPITWPLYVVPFTLLIHLTANIVAYTFGWKDVWW